MGPEDPTCLDRTWKTQAKAGTQRTMEFAMSYEKETQPASALQTLQPRVSELRSSALKPDPQPRPRGVHTHTHTCSHTHTHTRVNLHREMLTHKICQLLPNKESEAKHKQHHVWPLNSSSGKNKYPKRKPDDVTSTPPAAPRRGS